MEPTFRNPKGEVGLRPVWHAMQDRLQAHLIVAVLADYEVHLLCMLLLARKGIHTSWVGIRSQLSSWLRVTATLKAAAGELISPIRTLAPTPGRRRSRGGSVFQIL